MWNDLDNIVNPTIVFVQVTISLEFQIANFTMDATTFLVDHPWINLINIFENRFFRYYYKT